LEWAVVEGTEDPEIFECVACGKSFKSEAAWDSHERSKKHLKAVEMLRLEMEQDADEFGLQAAPEEEDVDDSVPGDPPRSLTPSGDEEESPRPDYPANEVDTQPPDPDPVPEHEPAKTKKSRRMQQIPDETLSKTERLAKERAAQLEIEETEQEQPVDTNGDAADDNPRNNIEQTSAPELSKKEKRRAREAAKKAQQTATKEIVRSSLTHFETILRRIQAV
jgi:DnaJ homolog subfamily A member 5